MTDKSETTVESVKASRAVKAPREPAKRSGSPKRYRSSQPAQVDGQYYKPGEPFVTDAPKGDDWEEITAREFAADEASTNRVPDDANLEAADKAALQAVAIIKHVNIVGLDKQGLIDAIKAANEPAL